MPKDTFAFPALDGYSLARLISSFNVARGDMISYEQGFHLWDVHNLYQWPIQWQLRVAHEVCAWVEVGKPVAVFYFPGAGGAAADVDHHLRAPSSRALR